MNRKISISFPLRWILPSAILAVWQFLSTAGFLPYYLLPSPVQVVKAFGEILFVGVPPSYTLPRHMGESLFRVLTGFFLAAVLGICAGVLMGWSAKLREFLKILIEVIRPIPPLAWVPIAILWFGIGMKSAIFIIFLGAFFPILLNTILGVVSTEKILIEASRILGATPRQIFFSVLMPRAMPSIFAGLRIGLGIGWMTLVAAEFTGVKSGYGLGHMVMTARDIQRPDEILAGMAIIGVLGFLMDWSLGSVGKRVLKWV